MIPGPHTLYVRATDPEGRTFAAQSAIDVVRP